MSYSCSLDQSAQHSHRSVFTVGAVLRGDDAAGPLLANMLESKPVEGWDVIDGEQMPEDHIATVRRTTPDFLLLVDAAKMGLEPGAIRILERDDVVSDYNVSTHSLPLSFLIDEISRYCGELMFLGVQPGQMDFYSPLTPQVLEAVEEIYRAIEKDDFSHFKRM